MSRSVLTVLGVVGVTGCVTTSVESTGDGSPQATAAAGDGGVVGTPCVEVDATDFEGEAGVDVACSDDQNTEPAPVPLGASASCAPTREPVAAWVLGGSAPSQYQTGFDSSTTCNCGPALHLASSTATGQQFGEMGMAKTAGAWSGQRVRLSGWVLASGVTGWAGLWMRVDGAQGSVVAFDNMQCRAISGTTGWMQVQVVLDVAADARDVAYGILLSDQGDVWLDGVVVEIVDRCVPTTGCP